MTELSFDSVVVGGGPAGLAAALVLARAGLGVALIDPAPEARPPAGRTTAVMRPQAELLRRHGAWPAAATGAPLRGLRIVNRPASGPLTEVLFTADELDVDCFAWNVPNRALVEALHTALGGAAVLLAAKLRTMRRAGGGWRLELEDGRTVRARLVVGADGKASRVRSALKIGARRHDYGQSANTALLDIDGAHDNISTEVHKPGGPFTTVPAGAGRVSLVWLEDRAEAERVGALDDDAFLAAVTDEDAGRHGRVTGVTGRAVVPIVGLLAHRLAAPGAVLMGEAAHAVSPLGAQGFNLTLRDCAALEDLARSRPLASADALKAYERTRLAESRVYFWFIDALNRAVQRPEAPIGIMRGMGLGLVDALGPVRRDLMHRLMRPRSLLAVA